MRVIIVPTREALGELAGKLLIARIAANPRIVLGVATGSTPEPLYAQLRKAYDDGTISLEQAHAFALDEYVGLAEDHPEGYRNVLRRELVGSTGLKEENLHTPNGHSDDPRAAAEEYEAAIAAFGGVDVQILGIGANGHIGFNEPYGSLNSRTRMAALTEKTRADNARFFDNSIDNVPTHCLTQGLGTIATSKSALLLANGKNKAEAVAALVQGPVTAQWPASVLQFHEDVTVIVDEDAASLLEMSDLFERVQP